MYGVTGQNQDVDIDIVQLFRAIWERKKTVIAATVLTAGVAFLFASSLEKQYKAETRLLIEPRILAADSAGAGNPPDELAISSQVQLLQSTDLIKQVAREMKLFELGEFDGGGGGLGGVLALFGIGGGARDLAPEERSLRAFRERLTVYQAPNSRVVAIEFSSGDPKLSAEVANKVAQVYLALQSGAKLDTSSDTARWLEPEIANLRDKVREAEKKVADYRASADLLQTSETSTLATQQLNDSAAELARVRGEKATAQARVEHVRNALATGSDTESLGEVVSAPAIQRLKEQESTTQSQIADLSTSLLEGHPRLKGLRAQLAGIRDQIRAETRRVLASLESEANVITIRERQLMQQLNTLKAESARAGGSQVDLNALEREATAQRQLLETYLARYREAASRLDSNAAPADARVISRAIAPRDVAFPKVIPITIVSALAGFLLAAVFVMLSELFSGRALRSIEDEGDEPVLIEEAKIVPAEPKAETTRNPMRAAFVEAAFTDADSHRTPAHDRETVGEVAITTPPADDEFSINGVVSALTDDRYSGRPILAISPDGDKGAELSVEMARRLAQSGLRVLIMDLTGTGVPGELTTERSDLPGLTDILTGNAVFNDIIHSDLETSLHVVPRGVADLHEALRSIERLPMILQAMTEAYERVIVECGPVGVEDVSRLLRGRAATLVITVPDPEDRHIESRLEDFVAAGFDDMLVLIEVPGPAHSGGRRQAA